MPIDVLASDRIPMIRGDRDVLKILHSVQGGKRTQAEAARPLGLGVRRVRRLQRKPEAGGDAAIVHGPCGQPSNHRSDAAFRRGKERAGPPRRGVRPPAYSRPSGARVALLRRPILPTAGRTITRRGRTVRPRSTRGGSRSNGGSDNALTADIPTVAEMRTFLLLPDNTPTLLLPVLFSGGKL